MDLPGHTDEVYCVDFVADKVVSGGRDKVVKMYVSLSSSLTAASSAYVVPSQMEALDLSFRPT
jgi:ribosome assembly protein 4